MFDHFLCIFLILFHDFQLYHCVTSIFQMFLSYWLALLQQGFWCPLWGPGIAWMAFRWFVFFRFWRYVVMVSAPLIKNVGVLKQQR